MGKAKAREKGGNVKETRSEGTLVQLGPWLHQGQAHPLHSGPLLHTKTNNLTALLQQNNSQTPQCTWMGPREHLNEWTQLGADKVLLQAIRKGVKAPMFTIPKSQRHPKTAQLTQATQETITEYLSTGAIRPLTDQVWEHTHQWTPTLTREKKAAEKSASLQTSGI